VKKLKKPTQNYTVVPNEIFTVEGVSAEAKFVYIYLISRPDGRNVNMKNIADVCGIGRQEAYNLVAELKNVGWVSYLRKNDGGGVFTLHELATSRKATSGKATSGISSHIVNKERAVKHLLLMRK